MLQRAAGGALAGAGRGLVENARQLREERLTPYWLMLALRDAVPRRMPLAWADFTSLRQKLLKNLPRIRFGGATRVIEKAARFRMLAGRLAVSGY